jgi:hypothetical protein
VVEPDGGELAGFEEGGDVAVGGTQASFLLSSSCSFLLLLLLLLAITLPITPSSFSSIFKTLSLSPPRTRPQGRVIGGWVNKNHRLGHRGSIPFPRRQGLQTQGGTSRVDGR